MWKRVMKIDLMILVAIAVLHTRKHLMALVWVLVGSIGFYGFKGGFFSIATGGEYLVWGPPESFIEGNNEIGLALIMTIPLMRFLQLQHASRWIKHGLTLLMILSAISAISTHSRGALLAIVAMASMSWRSRSKLILGVVIGVVALGLIAFMPRNGTHECLPSRTTTGQVGDGQDQRMVDGGSSPKTGPLEGASTSTMQTSAAMRLS
jgi:probable O-glycosylation ligase (exosortase A-associated)